eukprot:3144403-Amphidinium_carterae.2
MNQHPKTACRPRFFVEGWILHTSAGQMHSWNVSRGESIKSVATAAGHPINDGWTEASNSFWNLRMSLTWSERNECAEWVSLQIYFDANALPQAEVQSRTAQP